MSVVLDLSFARGHAPCGETAITFVTIRKQLLSEVQLIEYDIGRVARRLRAQTSITVEEPSLSAQHRAVVARK